jgi:integrase
LPTRSPQLPRYRHYKPKDLAVVRIDGRDYYLGKFGSEASKEKYRRLIAESLASPTSSLPLPTGSDANTALTINDAILAYWDRYVVPHYVKDGRPTSEQDNIRQALRFLRRLYGHTPAAAFGPVSLKAVRQAMIEARRCRTLINKDVNRIRSLFRWATEEELYPGSAYQALRAVQGLAKGRSAAKELPPVSEVAYEVVLATLLHLSSQVAAMVRLQLLSAARPGEIASLRPRDLDCSDPEGWLFRPASHKTEHHGRERVIVLGPRAQEVLRPWLDRDPEAYCYCPAEVVAARPAARRAATLPTPGHRPAARPKPGGRYTKDSYRVAIQRACRRAGVPVWTPHQLRHTRATEIRREFDIEAAQIILGHSKPDTTLVYAERNLSRARAVMARIG